MDDVTDFEQRLAADLERLAGPRRPVDAMAISRATTTAPRSRTWSIVTRRAQRPFPDGRAEGRSRTMFGLFGYAAAAIVVALFGGYILVGLPQRPPDRVPAATSVELVPTGLEMAVPPRSPGYGYQLVRDADGDVWSLGERLMRFRDRDGTLELTGEWTPVDDVAFAGNWMMVPARGAGVWLVGSDIRHFDGDRLVDVVEVPVGGPTGLAEALDGSLWAAVDGGVVRWDGSSWGDTGVGYEADILGIDAGGGVWVNDGTDSGPTHPGVSRFDGTSWRTYGVDDHPRLDGFDYGSLGNGPNGTIDLPANGAVLAFDGRTWTELPDAPYVGETGLISVGPDGTLWLADAETVYSRSPDGSLETVDEPTGGLSGITSLIALDHGALVSTADGLHRIADGVTTTAWQVEAQAGPGGDVWPLRIATDSVAWISDEAGVWRCPAPATDEGCRLMDEGLPPLNGEGMVSVALAPDDSLWATGPVGTARLVGETWELVDGAPGQAVAIGPEGTAWVLGSDCTLVSWRPGATGWIPERHAANESLCMGGGAPYWMGVRPDRSVWVLQAGFVADWLLSYDGRAWTEPLGTDVAGRPVDQVDSAAIDADGQLWVTWVDWRDLEREGSQPAVFGTARLDDAGWTVVSEGESRGRLAAGPDGSVWLGSEDGLLRYDGTGWIPDRLTGMSVNPMDVSPDGAVWVTDGASGLYRLPADMTSGPSSDGTPSASPSSAP